MSVKVRPYRRGGWRWIFGSVFLMGPNDVNVSKHQRLHEQRRSDGARLGNDTRA
jgi:hypothetical protein